MTDLRVIPSGRSYSGERPTPTPRAWFQIYLWTGVMLGIYGFIAVLIFW